MSLENIKMGRELIGITDRYAKEFALRRVEEKHLTDDESYLLANDIYKLAVDQCVEGVTDDKLPAWNIGVVLYSLKSRLAADTTTNRILKKRYLLSIWNEKGSNVNHATLRKGKY